MHLRASAPNFGIAASVLPYLRVLDDPDVLGGERGEEGWVQEVLAWDPESFFWTVALPVQNILQAAPTASGVHDLIDEIHRVQQERQKGLRRETSER